MGQPQSRPGRWLILDGVLAIDLAEAEGIISREAFRTWTDHFTAMVDYTIQ